MSPWSVEVTRGAFMYPSEVGAECAVAAAAGRAVRALNGQNGEVFYSPAALDAGYLNQRDIETIMFGPGDLRFAHTDEEVVSMQEVRDAARVYAGVALEVLASEYGIGEFIHAFMPDPIGLLRGKSAHSSMPWDGINAVDGARKVLELLDRLNLGAEHSGLGKATLTVTQIKSAPDISHTVPDTCRITLDRRLLPGDDPDAALRDIHEAVVDLPPWSVEVTPGAFMYPSEVGADCAVASAVRRAGRALKEQDGEVFYSPAALDAGYLNQRGIETIMFGPGDLRFAHTDEEVVSLQEVRDAARIYAATALELLA